MAFAGDCPLIPGSLVTTLVCCMPRKPGACFHYRFLPEATGPASAVCSALFAVGEEAVEVDGKSVPAFRFEALRAYGGAVTTSWVGKDGHLVRMYYGGSVSTLSTKAAALEGLHPALKPRTPN